MDGVVVLIVSISTTIFSWSFTTSRWELVFVFLAFFFFVPFLSSYLYPLPVHPYYFGNSDIGGWCSRSSFASASQSTKSYSHRSIDKTTIDTPENAKFRTSATRPGMMMKTDNKLIRHVKGVLHTYF